MANVELGWRSNRIVGISGTRYSHVSRIKNQWPTFYSLSDLNRRGVAAADGEAATEQEEAFNDRPTDWPHGILCNRHSSAQKGKSNSPPSLDTMFYFHRPTIHLFHILSFLSTDRLLADERLRHPDRMWPNSIRRVFCVFNHKVRIQVQLQENTDLKVQRRSSYNSQWWCMSQWLHRGAI